MLKNGWNAIQSGTFCMRIKRDLYILLPFPFWYLFSELFSSSLVSLLTSSWKSWWMFLLRQWWSWSGLPHWSPKPGNKITVLRDNCDWCNRYFHLVHCPAVAHGDVIDQPAVAGHEHPGSESRNGWITVNLTLSDRSTKRERPIKMRLSVN